MRGAVKILLSPVVRFCVKHSISFQEVSELLKHVFVIEAKEHLDKNNAKVNVTQISAITGIRRKEVDRLFIRKEEKTNQRGFLAQLVTAWVQSAEDPTAPRPLSCQGTDSEFYELARSVTLEVTPRSLLNQLVSTGIVKISDDGSLAELQRVAYDPVDVPLESFEILRMDMTDIIEAVEENIVDRLDPPHLHMTTEYDELEVQSSPEIRTWLLEEGNRFHARVRRYLSQYDYTLNRADHETPKEMLRVVIGTFSRTTSVNLTPEEKK